MRRRLCLIPLVVLALVVALGALGQLLLPGYTANRIEDRLTEGGDSALVSVDAFPAARLLFGDGDRLEVRGSGLELDLTRDTDVFERLDGYHDVDVRLEDFRAGPFEVASFELTRAGSSTYRLASTSVATPGAIAGYGASELGVPLAPLLGYYAGRVPGATQPVPIELNMEIESEDGRIVVSGGGTVAGFPTGPLARMLTQAIVLRL